MKKNCNYIRDECYVNMIKIKFYVVFYFYDIWKSVLLKKNIQQVLLVVVWERICMQIGFKRVENYVEKSMIDINKLYLYVILSMRK